MKQYIASHRMRDLLADNAFLLPVLSRFNISLGFGDRSVGEVCRDRSVDTDTFLAVANYISHKPYHAERLHVPTLLTFLRNAHNYFLAYVLPNIRRRLIEAISVSGANDIAFIMLKFFDQYVDEVHRHMSYENAHVFTYVQALLDGSPTPEGFSISTFRSQHEPISAKLREMKEIFISHYSSPDSGHADLLNTVLFDIVVCERDLAAHCGVEDALFIPAVEALEAKAEQKAPNPTEADADNQPGLLDENGDIILTAREREIVKAIARGLSNKEIAAELYLSPFTVATHRRNICAKLNIHSASGMTLFAIIHGILSMEEGAKMIK